ncbi:hypothetical protein GEMRC1_000638 [Eukaryota sp. GEM-RC1]
MLDKFNSGETQIISNVGVLTTGFDNPRVDMIVFNQTTYSQTLYEQIIGRGLRVAEGKENLLVYELYDIAFGNIDMDDEEEEELDNDIEELPLIDDSVIEGDSQNEESLNDKDKSPKKYLFILLLVIVLIIIIIFIYKSYSSFKTQNYYQEGTSVVARGTLRRNQ